MRTLAVSLVVFAFAAPVIAQSNPLGTVVGGVTNAANGMLGNSPAGASGGRRGHGHAPAARGIPGLPGVPNPLSGNFSRQVLTATADGYMQVPLESFLAARALHHPPYNWNSSGCRFGEVATGSYGMSPLRPLVHVDIDPSVPGRNVPADLAIAADAADAASAAAAHAAHSTPAFAAASSHSASASLSHVMPPPVP